MGQKQDTPDEEIVTPEMLQFAATFNDALGKMKQAVETDTRCLLDVDEAGAVLSYVSSVIAHMRETGAQ